MFSPTKRFAVVTIFAAVTLALGAHGAYDGTLALHEHVDAVRSAPTIPAATLIPGATLTQNPQHVPGNAPDDDHYVLIPGGIRPDIFAHEPPRDPTSELQIYASALTGLHPSAVAADPGGHAPVVVPLPAGWLLLVSGLAALRRASRA